MRPPLSCRSPLVCGGAKRVDRLLQPAPEVPAAGHHVEHACPCCLRVEPELNVDEGPALSVCQQPMRVCARIEATQRHLAAVVKPLDRDIRLDEADWRLEDLAVAATLLEPLA